MPESLERYVPLVRSVAFSIWRSRDFRGSLDEVLSDAMVGLWEAHEKFDSKKATSTFEIFASTYIRQRIADGYRLRVNRDVNLDDVELTSVDNTPVDFVAINKLLTKPEQILLWEAFEGIPKSETRKKLGINNYATYHNWRRRIAKKLRRYLAA